MDMQAQTLAQLPPIITQAGPRASKRFLEFFTVNIRNANTRAAYARAVGDFLAWCTGRGVRLETIEPMVVAAYIEQHRGAPQTVQQHLAAIRMLFDYLVVGQVMPFNPAAPVRGPRYVSKRGKTPVLSPADTRLLLDSIGDRTVVDLRDRALIAVMVYTFARVGAVVQMNLDDYYSNGDTFWIRLHEKGGRLHEVPVHHKAKEYLDAYIQASAPSGEVRDKRMPLFRTAPRRRGTLTSQRMDRMDVFRMIRRRAGECGLAEGIGCHTFRATGITTYLANGGTLERAQQLAAHESPMTTKLYDRTTTTITAGEMERILI
jgi:site-specific recombinase XerD